jgi:hypothetical protein
MGADDELEYVLSQGPATEAMQALNHKTMAALTSAGWSMQLNIHSVNNFKLPRISIDRNFDGTAWKSIVRFEKNKLFKRKFSGPSVGFNTEPGKGPVRNDAYVVPGLYLTKDYVPPVPEWGRMILEIAVQFKLNAEQRKAFNIVVNHATCVGPEQLLMYLGGMGGTGKTQVIQALEAYFEARNESYRFVLLGPTGTSAALIGGSTYHSFLGLRTSTVTTGPKTSFDDVLERLIRCGYIFLDEHSMLSCIDLCRISAKICEVLGVFEKPFGGLNVILAGDFAQLAPAGSFSLYSRAVTLVQSPGQTVTEQENTIGKMIWLQFKNVVILKQNMRQIGDQIEEVAFHRALCNLRYWKCTNEDINLIRSRVISPLNNLSLDNAPWKNVSIITSFN